MSEPTAPEWFRVPMVERVADAMYASRMRLAKRDFGPDWPTGTLAESDWPIREIWLEAARAAIVAMREPNLAMRKAVSFREAEITWPTMIDAALADGKAPKTDGDA